jgi:hypothetical protein
MSEEQVRAGEEIMIDPHHPFYGGRMGVFEFMTGKYDEIAVFSKPRQTEEEVKIYFMIRPEDEINQINWFVSQNQARAESTETIDDQVCRWLDEDRPALHTMVIDT